MLESTKKGYVMVPRQLLHDMIHECPQAAGEQEAFLRVLLYANYKESVYLRNGRKYACARGESLFSYMQWAEILGWSRGRTMRFFKKMFTGGRLVHLDDGLPTHLRIPDYDAWTPRAATLSAPSGTGSAFALPGTGSAFAPSGAGSASALPGMGAAFAPSGMGSVSALPGAGSAFAPSGAGSAFAPSGTGSASASSGMGSASAPFGTGSASASSGMGSASALPPDNGFRNFWEQYHEITRKDKVNPGKARKAWNRLSTAERTAAVENIEIYYCHLTNTLFCLQAVNYLANKAFMNEYEY